MITNEEKIEKLAQALRITETQLRSLLRINKELGERIDELEAELEGFRGRMREEQR